jgi:RNA polymerase sigma-54 factor
MYILPDVIVTRTVDGFEVEVVESKRFALRINSMYRTLSTSLGSGSALSAEEREHIRQYVHRAKLFIANISQRRQTLSKITWAIVEHQQEFLSRGIRYLRPLSRAAIATDLGIHESTVSRATAAKHVMLPDGEIIPYSHFFTPSLSVKDVMKEVIEREPGSLTDAEIAERLADRGIHIARRTVAKYRAQLDILPSRLRA